MNDFRKPLSGLRVPFLIFFTGVLSACGSRELKVAASPTYQSIQSNTISPKCIQCHQSLSTYDGVLKIVTPGNAAKSDFFKQIDSGSMPQQSTKLSDAEIQAVFTWIQNGARND